MDTAESDSVSDITADVASAVDSSLPDDSELDTEALLHVLHGAGENHERRWRQRGVTNALNDWELFDLEDGINGFADRLFEGMNVSPDDPTGRVSPNMETTEGADLYQSLQWSWDIIFTEDSTPRVACRPPTQVSADTDIWDVLDEHGLTSEGKQIDRTFQSACVVGTLCLMVQELKQSTLTEREFVAFHLGTRHPAQTAASIATDIFDTEQSSGAIRSNISRVKEKFTAANATTNIAGGGQLTAEDKERDGHQDVDEIPPQLRKEIRTHIGGAIRSNSSSSDSTVVKDTWPIDDGMRLGVSIDTDEQVIGVWLTVEIEVLSKALSDPVTVPKSEVDGTIDSEKVTVDPDGHPTVGATQFSNPMSIHLIQRAVEFGLPWGYKDASHGNMLHLDLFATAVEPSDQDESVGQVRFAEWVQYTEYQW